CVQPLQPVDRPCAGQSIRRKLADTGLGAGCANLQGGSPDEFLKNCVRPSPFPGRTAVLKGGPAMNEVPMREDTSNNVSRRNFIKGVIAAGAAVSSASYLFRSTPLLGQQTGTPGAVERLITLNVNGQDRRVDVMPQETLAMVLRYKLGLTGTKLGCDRAECG